jgi:hypothetical protein
MAMDQAQEDCRKLLAEVRKTLGFPGEEELRAEPRYYADSLALCLIDSIQSLRNDYVGVVIPVVRRYVDFRARQGGNATTDGMREFLTAQEEMGGVATWSATVGTANTAPGTSVLKGEVMRQTAEALSAIGIDSTADLRRAALEPDGLARVRKTWMGIHGNGKAGWDYLLMGAGLDGSKADTMILRFATRALQLEKTVSPSRAQAALKCAAATLEVTERRLDHAIWFFESEAARKRRNRGGGR